MKRAICILTLAVMLSSLNACVWAASGSHASGRAQCHDHAAAILVTGSSPGAMSIHTTADSPPTQSTSPQGAFDDSSGTSSHGQLSSQAHACCAVSAAPRLQPGPAPASQAPLNRPHPLWASLTPSPDLRPPI